MSDLEPMLALQSEAFADKFRAAFGRRRIARGYAALIAVHRMQGQAGLQGMHVALADQQIVGTITMRTTEMRLEDGGMVDAIFLRELGIWGSFRATHAMSQLDHRIGRHEGYITDVAVLPAFRRRGVAAAMLQHVREIAKRYQKQRLGLYVSASNDGARRLYQQLGFRDEQARISWWNGWLLGERRWLYMTSPVL